MRKVIKGKVYDTATADLMCAISCTVYGNDFAWHKTNLYRTAMGK